MKVDDAETVRDLREFSNTLYWTMFAKGFGARAHAFLELSGVASKLVDLYERAAVMGISPHLISEHSGRSFPAQAHDMKYLGEKLRCMFGPAIDNNPVAKAALHDALFGPEP